ncbi:MAG: enoyl-CoA hydratase family protein [Myxococcota bacterium]|nr:enoyl-CoA hydratase family protein [Myxococcota bacterium]MDW8363854.1 enoyl-CoA hydratase family protein [Myxococcales bacterium]
MTIEGRSFRTHTEEGVLEITLDRPQRINALTFEIYAELRDAFRALARDPHPDVRAVLLRGAGERGFCSGGDVEDIIGKLFERDAAGLLEFTRMTGALVGAIRRCPKPVVAALHGVTCGAGAVIALAADLRIATPETRIAFLFPQVGLSGADMGAAWLLPRIVGLGIASELLLEGQFVDAARAERIGLVNAVVPAERLLDEARERARRLASGPAFAHAMTKRMLESEAAMDFEAALEAEAQAQALCMMHPDFREAYEARKARRPPRFA